MKIKFGEVRKWVEEGRDKGTSATCRPPPSADQQEHHGPFP